MDFLMVWVKCHHLVQCLISLTQVQEVVRTLRRYTSGTTKMHTVWWAFTNFEFHCRSTA